MLAASTLGTGCGGGARHAAEAGPGLGASHHVTLALETGGPVSADLPSKPLGTVPTGVPNLDLEAWSLQRQGGAVTVVIAFHNNGPALDSGAYTFGALVPLDVNGPGANTTANNIGILDTGSLKEYLTFAQVNSDGRVSDCLCSNDINTGNAPAAGARAYYAAVVAAPPPTTKSVTLVTGDGSIANLPISG